MAEPYIEFQSPERKLNRAKHHIEAFKRELVNYTAATTGTRVVEPLCPNDGELWARWEERLKSDGPVYLHRIHLTFPNEHELEEIASDALQNLRQALDHAACACARAMGKSDKGTWFPLVGADENLEDAIKDKCRKLPQTIKDIIRANEPGGGLLFELHELGIRDKHRILCQVGNFGAAGMRYLRASANGWIASGFGANEWDPVNGDIRYALSGSPDELDYAFDFDVTVNFNTGGALAAKPALSALYTLADMVEDIIRQMRTEMVRQSELR